MSENELQLLVECLKWAIRYDDSNPDVGFGVSPEYMLQGICNQCNMNLSVEDVATVIGLYNMRHGRNRR
jgi:hypothetical protein